MAEKRRGGRASQKRLISERAVYALRDGSKDSSYAKRYSDKQLSKIIDQYAQVANSRLRKIEKEQLQGSSPAYQAIKTMAHDKRGGVTKSIRFKKAGKQSREQMVEELYQLHQFVFKAKTSKVVDIRNTNERRAKATIKAAKSLNKSFATDLEEKLSGDAETRDTTLRNIGQFFNNENIRQLIDAYGSDTVLELVEAVYGEADEVSLDAFGKLINKMADEYMDLYDEIYHISFQDLIERLKDYRNNMYSSEDFNEEW